MVTIQSPGGLMSVATPDQMSIGTAQEIADSKREIQKRRRARTKAREKAALPPPTVIISDNTVTINGTGFSVRPSDQAAFIQQQTGGRGDSAQQAINQARQNIEQQRQSNIQAQLTQQKLQLQAQLAKAQTQEERTRLLSQFNQEVRLIKRPPQQQQQPEQQREKKSFTQLIDERRVADKAARTQSKRETTVKDIDGFTVERTFDNSADAIKFGTVKAAGLIFEPRFGMGRQLKVKPEVRTGRFFEDIGTQKTGSVAIDIATAPIRTTQLLFRAERDAAVKSSKVVSSVISKADSSRLAQDLVKPLGFATQRLEAVEETLKRPRGGFTPAISFTQISRGAVTQIKEKPVSTSAFVGLGFAGSFGLGAIAGVSTGASVIAKTAGVIGATSFVATKGFQLAQSKDLEEFNVNLGKETAKIAAFSTGAKLGTKFLKFSTQEIQLREATRIRKPAEVRIEIKTVKDLDAGKTLTRIEDFKLKAEVSPPIKVTTTTALRQRFGLGPLRSKVIPAKIFKASNLQDLPKEFIKELRFSAKRGGSGLQKLFSAKVLKQTSDATVVSKQGVQMQKDANFVIKTEGVVKQFGKARGKPTLKEKDPFVQFLRDHPKSKVKSEFVELGEIEIGKGARRSFFQGFSQRGRQRGDFNLMATERSFLRKNGQTFTEDDVGGMALGSSGGRGGRPPQGSGTLSEVVGQASLAVGGRFESFMPRTTKFMQTVDVLGPLSFPQNLLSRTNQRQSSRTTQRQRQELKQGQSFKQQLSQKQLQGQEQQQQQGQSHLQRQRQQQQQQQQQLTKQIQKTITKVRVPVIPIPTGLFTPRPPRFPPIKIPKFDFPEFKPGRKQTKKKKKKNGRRVSKVGIQTFTERVIKGDITGKLLRKRLKRSLA